MVRVASCGIASPCGSVALLRHADEMVFPLHEQPEHVQRLVAIAAARDVEGLRRDVIDALTGLPAHQIPHVAQHLVGALDRFIDSYIDQAQH